MTQPVMSAIRSPLISAQKPEMLPTGGVKGTPLHLEATWLTY